MNRMTSGFEKGLPPVFPGNKPFSSDAFRTGHRKTGEAATRQSPLFRLRVSYFTRSFQPMTIRFLSLMMGFHFSSCSTVV